MKNVAKHIDQVKRNLEQQSRVKELSGILDGWLGPELTVLGDLKLEGMLMENNKPRIVLLFQNMMIITKKKEDNRLQLKTYIQVSEAITLMPATNRSERFSIKYFLFLLAVQRFDVDRAIPGRTGQFQCDSVQRYSSESNQIDGSES